MGVVILMTAADLEDTSFRGDFCGECLRDLGGDFLGVLMRLEGECFTSSSSLSRMLKELMASLLGMMAACWRGVAVLRGILDGENCWTDK